MLLTLSMYSRSRYALYSLYLVTGVGLSSWLSRTPALKAVLGLNIDNVGMVLLSFSIGALVGILSAGKLVSIYKVSNVAFSGFVCLCLGLAFVSLSGIFISILFAVFGLFLFGVGMGWADISLNIEASALEKVSQRQVLTTLHANFSLGAFLGAFGGFMATHFKVGMTFHLALITVLIAIIALWVTGSAFQAAGPGTDSDSSFKSTDWRHALRDRELHLICLVVLTMALVEGAANDWLPLLMINGYGFSDSTASMFYMIFSLCMAMGRFFGGAVVDKMGRTNSLILSSVLSALGMVLIISLDDSVVVMPAIVIWAMGAALGFPVSLSAAGAAEQNGELRVKVAATSGYMAFLVGPPMLGFLGEDYGLRAALLPVFALTIIVLSLLLSADGRKAVG